MNSLSLTNPPKDGHDTCRGSSSPAHRRERGAVIQSFPCRAAERLQWHQVDFEQHCLRLPDSKTGAKVIYLNPPALELLVNLPRGSANPWVFVGRRAGGCVGGIDKVWVRVRAAAGLQQVRLHDLRHSFASVGVVGGLSLPVIGALLGTSTQPPRHDTRTYQQIRFGPPTMRWAHGSPQR